MLLLIYAALRTGHRQFFFPALFLGDLFRYAGRSTFRCRNLLGAGLFFLFTSVNFGLFFFLLRPQHQKGLQLPTMDGLGHVLVQLADLLQSGQLFFLPLGQLFMALIVPDILLHRFNIRFIGDVADILGDESLDVHNRAKGHRLFHHPQNLFIVHIPTGQHIQPVLFLAIIHLPIGKILLQVAAQRRNIHGFALFNKAVFRQFSHIDEKAVLPAAIAAAIKHHTGDKTVSLHQILKLAGNVTRKIFSPAGVGVLFVHVRPQVTIQRALGFFVGGLVEVSGVGLPQQHNLQGINHSGFPRTIFSSKKIDVIHRNDFLAEIQPVNQQDFPQLLHRCLPPFSAGIPPHLIFHWKRQTAP